MSLWQGRVDSEETAPAWRWHQKIRAWDGTVDLDGSVALVGFACDEGVRRNKGRPGARGGPRAIRAALAGLAYPAENDAFDAGDIVCKDENLELAQIALSECVGHVLQKRGFPVVLGGGHEVAWGSFLGLANYLGETSPASRIGILNFDAHFDLRNPRPQANSGTPFRQIAEWCAANGCSFSYAVLGLNPAANTAALFEFAKQHAVTWYSDLECNSSETARIFSSIETLLSGVDVLYLTLCLDVFPASAAPGVSAPASVGVEPAWAIRALHKIFEICRKSGVSVGVADIAEMNPDYDRDAMTAKLAARLVHEIVFGKGKP